MFDGGDGKDDRPVQIAGGLVAPAIILFVVGLNLVNWTVIVPGRSGVYVGSESPIVAGIVLMKSALALCLYFWFWVANQKTIEHHAPLGMFFAGIVGAAGVIILAYGTFRDII